MAIHNSHKSMIKESLPEILSVSEYCVNFGKDPKIWGSGGCYGYPANILLLAITDAIGSYIIRGKTRDHFDILKHPNFYNLSLNDAQITKIYKAYRCLGTHNAVLGRDVILDIGDELDLPFSEESGRLLFKLKPFLKLSKEVVNNFLNVADTFVPTEVIN